MNDDAERIEVTSYDELEERLVNLVVENKGRISNGVANTTDNASIEINATGPGGEKLYFSLTHSDDRTMTDWIQRFASKRFLRLDPDSGCYKLLPENILLHQENKEKLRGMGSRLETERNQKAKQETNRQLRQKTLVIMLLIAGTVVISTIVAYFTVVSFLPKNNHEEIDNLRRRVLKLEEKLEKNTD